jgi:aromatic ring-opening dioxygenase catalytic subunit (LigB family)
MLPTCFVNHGGGPMPILGDASQASLTASLRSLRATLAASASPAMAALRAILVISAHWETPGSFQVLTAPDARAPVPLHFDYFGFPPQTYEYTYAAPGAPGVAARVCELLNGAGLAAHAVSDGEREGYDHGVFIPLLLAFPAKDVPIVQLSLKAGLDPAEHINAGRALAPLRDEGVLILGSGMSYHNMQHFMSDHGPGSIAGRQAAAFDAWLQDTLSPSRPIDERLSQLAKWESVAPYARHCHPREEHLAPMFVVAGAASQEDVLLPILDDVCMGKKITSFAFVTSRRIESRSGGGGEALSSVNPLGNTDTTSSAEVPAEL